MFNNEDRADMAMRKDETMATDNLTRGLFHLLNGETAHGLTIVQHDDEPPRATPTYLLNLNIGWADQIIAERMYLSDARGIAYILADALCCPVSDVEDPAALPSGSTGTGER